MAGKQCQPLIIMRLTPATGPRLARMVVSGGAGTSAMALYGTVLAP